MIPKYRIWSKELEKILPVKAIIFDDEVVIADMGYSDEARTVKWTSGFKFEEVELMQSTGLTDKNGVEIFEGDILENVCQHVYLENRATVVLNNKWASFELLNNWCACNIPISESYYSYKVIGNIYENKNLVEVE